MGERGQERRKHLFAIDGSAATTGIPVLVLSTDPRLLEKAQDQAARYGTHRYLDKPFDIDAILAQVKEIIGEARPSRQGNPFSLGADRPPSTTLASGRGARTWVDALIRGSGYRSPARLGR